MKTYTVLHLFSGLGGGALGFKMAGFKSVGNVDAWQGACEDLEYLVDEPAHQHDIATMTPADLRAVSPTAPDVVFTSPPCKGFSGCMPERLSQTGKYQAMNSLAERGIWLALETWENPPKIIVMENVPRILSRGRDWLDACQAMLRSYGYSCRETTHDCGEIGGLAQHRRRFLLVARHMAQVPEFLYVPPVQRVRGVGEVLGDLPIPLPDSKAGGDMHNLPKLSPLNWVRLALIRPGRDWQDLPDAVALDDRQTRFNGGFGVSEWDKPANTVIGLSTVRHTWSSVCDPRLTCEPRTGAYGVVGFEDASHCIVGSACHDNSRVSIADPRATHTLRRGNLKVHEWEEPSATILGASTAYHGQNVCDPRSSCERRDGALGVTPWNKPTHAVIAAASIQNTGLQVADPRWITHEAVVSDGETPAIVGPALDLDTLRPCHLLIRALDGTWHRPMTTLELAAIQGFPTRLRGDWLRFAGRSHKAWRERIGNAVPPPAALAIAASCLATLIAADEGKLLLRGEPVWVQEQLKSIREKMELYAEVSL